MTLVAGNKSRIPLMISLPNLRSSFFAQVLLPTDINLLDTEPGVSRSIPYVGSSNKLATSTDTSVVDLFPHKTNSSDPFQFQRIPGKEYTNNGDHRLVTCLDGKERVLDVALEVLEHAVGAAGRVHGDVGFSRAGLEGLD